MKGEDGRHGGWLISLLVARQHNAGVREHDVQRA